jgi:hypothetical protein
MEEQTEEQKKPNKARQAWNWIWHSDSLLSWIVALALAFVVVKFINIVSLIKIVFAFGIFIGGLIFSEDGNRALLSNNSTYNIIAFVDKDAPAPVDGARVVELVVSDPDDLDDHHFVRISKECFGTYHNGARYLLRVSDTKCVWLP